MVRIYISRLSICFMIIFIIVLMGCEITRDNVELKPPKKPAGVPKEAIWSGGLDGGVFILIKKDKNSPPNIYLAEIYFDSTGEIWYKGRMSMEPSEKPSFDYKNKEVYSGWDGDILYLRDGRMLKAIDPKK